MISFLKRLIGKEKRQGKTEEDLNPIFKIIKEGCASCKHEFQRSSDDWDYENGPMVTDFADDETCMATWSNLWVCGKCDRKVINRNRGRY